MDNPTCDCDWSSTDDCECDFRTMTSMLNALSVRWRATGIKNRSWYWLRMADELDAIVTPVRLG